MPDNPDLRNRRPLSPADVAAAEKRAQEGGAKNPMNDTSAAIANAPAGPEFLEEIDRRRAAAAGGGTIQDLVDAVLMAPGDVTSWTKTLVEKSKGNIDSSEARSRVLNSMFWYRRKKKLIPEGNLEKLVDA